MSTVSDSMDLKLISKKLNNELVIMSKNPALNKSLFRRCGPSLALFPLFQYMCAKNDKDGIHAIFLAEHLLTLYYQSSVHDMNLTEFIDLVSLTGHYGNYEHLKDWIADALECRELLSRLYGLPRFPLDSELAFNRYLVMPNVSFDGLVNVLLSYLNTLSDCKNET